MKFPFVLKVKPIIFRYPKIWAHYSLTVMCSNIGTPKTINFPFGTNGKLMVLGVPILKHFRVTAEGIFLGNNLHYMSHHKFSHLFGYMSKQC